MMDMELKGRIAIGLVCGLCVLAFGINIYPGLLHTLDLPLFFFVFGSAPIVAIFLLTWLNAYGLQNCQTYCKKCVSVPRWSRRICSVIILISLVLLIFYVPRRIGFAVSRSAFQRYADAHQQADSGITKLKAWFGVYKVDQFSIDPRGGMYFRTQSCGDGLGPDEMSFGFCYQPNSDGSPFGNAFRIRDELPFPKFTNVERAEEFIGLCKPCQQVIKTLTINSSCQILDQGTLGRPRRTVQE
jgi:hypothetical protein